jgi:hypothetical protein
LIFGTPRDHDHGVLEILLLNASVMMTVGKEFETGTQKFIERTEQLSRAMALGVRILAGAAASPTGNPGGDRGSASVARMVKASSEAGMKPIDILRALATSAL